MNIFTLTLDIELYKMRHKNITKILLNSRQMFNYIGIYDISCLGKALIPHHCLTLAADFVIIP